MAFILCSTTFSTSFDDANFTISHQKGTTQIHAKLSKGNTFSEGNIRVCNIEVFFKQYFGNKFNFNLGY